MTKAWIAPTVVIVILAIAGILISAFVPGGWARNNGITGGSKSAATVSKNKPINYKAFSGHYDDKSACDGGPIYGCLTHLVGSKALIDAAKKDKYDGLYAFGSLGNGNTQLGKCYELNVEGRKKPIIGQVINQSADSLDGQFDMYMADGGFGLFEACSKMYEEGSWGHRYGGWDSKSECKNLPKWPIDCPDGKCTSETQNLQELCEFSFDENLRLDAKQDKKAALGGLQESNPSFTGKRVECPNTLTKLSGLSFSGKWTSEELDGTLTRIMDCCKPSAAWHQTPNQVGLVTTCHRDGYTPYARQEA
jgi:hypothetical protein